MSSGPAVSWLSTKLSKQLSKMGALQKVKEAAEKGDAKAMTLMGVCYGMGRDVEQDDAKAAEWFKKAADAGNGEACLAYGIWLLGGKGGVARSAPEAVKYLQVAEKGGVTQAQTVLGIIFMSGDDGVVRDSTKALKLFTKAAEAGDAQAMHNLGMMLTQGIGTVVSISRGTDWIRRAATAGVVESQFTMHCWYRDGTKQLKQNHKKSFEWALKAANQGYDQAMHNVGAMYDEGVGVAENKAEAMAWYKKAMELGVTDSMVNLGKCLVMNPNKREGEAQAGLELFCVAADEGNMRGQWNAAATLWNLAEELGLEKDAARSMAYLEQAARQGHAQALQEQARRYGAGEGVDKDMDKALEIQMQAQEQRELDLRHQS